MYAKACSACECEYRADDPEQMSEHFCKDKNSPDGLFHRCKVCEADRVSIYYANNWQTISDERYERRATDPDYAAREREATRKRVADYRARQRAQLQASA